MRPGPQEKVGQENKVKWVPGDVEEVSLEVCLSSRHSIPVNRTFSF